MGLFVAAGMELCAMLAVEHVLFVKQRMQGNDGVQKASLFVHNVARNIIRQKVGNTVEHKDMQLNMVSR